MIEKVYKLIISQYYGEKLLCFNYVFSYRIYHILLDAMLHINKVIFYHFVKSFLWKILIYHVNLNHLLYNIVIKINLKLILIIAKK